VSPFLETFQGVKEMANKIRGRNEGSIWRQGNNWRAAVSLNGKRITKSFKTKTECKVWLHENLNQIDLGLTIGVSKVTIDQFLCEWMDIHMANIKPKSGQRYQQIARDYVLPYLGQFQLQALRIEHIEDLYQNLLQRGVSVRNVRYVHSLLHRSLSDAVKRGVVGLNASHGARQPKLVQQEMKILDENQVMQFFIAVQDDRNEALYHMAIKTGMRQGELLGLKWTDLDWNRGKIGVQRQVQRVAGKGMVFMPPKTQAGRRAIPLGEGTLRILREHKAKQQHEREIVGDQWQDYDLIFPSSVGTPQSPSNLLKSFKSVLKQSGLPIIRFHDLRHTAASLMLNQGVPPFVVSKILGHSKPSTTMDIYGHLIPVMHEGIGNLMDEMLTPIPVQMGEVSQNSPIPDQRNR
jgi:integrase